MEVTKYKKQLSTIIWDEIHLQVLLINGQGYSGAIFGITEANLS